MRYKLVAFDMDGTLIEEGSCWDTIHRRFGTGAAADKNLGAWERGEIDYPEFMRRDIRLWQPPPSISEIREILSEFTLAPNAVEVVAGIYKRGYQAAIVTGGIDLLANEVAKRLGIGYVLANGLATDERGRLTGEGIFRVEPNRKHEALARLAGGLGLSLGECIAVGDSRYDINFLKHAGLGVAIGSDVTLARVADVVVEDLAHFSQLLNHLSPRRNVLFKTSQVPSEF
jgi:phosphoserine phosphatase